MVSVADDDHHVSMIVYIISCIASTVASATAQSPATAQSLLSTSSTLSSPPTGEHALSAGVYVLVHNVDVCTAGTDTVSRFPVSRFQFMEAVASKIPSKWKRVGVSLEMDQSQLDGIEWHRRGDCLECFSDVFSYWQQQSTPQSPANWATLVTVLRSNYVGEEVLADYIQNTFMYQ